MTFRSPNIDGGWAAGPTPPTSSHKLTGCCLHGGRLRGGLPRWALVRLHPDCPCCCQRRGGFHPGERGGLRPAGGVAIPGGAPDA